MKKLLYILLISGFVLSLSSCWREDMPEAGAPRHQVTNLTAMPGDEEVVLNWDVPDGWNPTDFIVFYTEDDKITMHTDGAMSCKVEGLANGKLYDFSVQAVYGDLISNAVVVSATPSTSRFAVTDLAADGGDMTVTLSWTKPAATVLSYKLSYFNDADPSDVRSMDIDKDATSVEVTDLTNDVNYTFSLVAMYTKGASEAATVKAMPALAIPYFLSRSEVAIGQPITFMFNSEAFPTAADVKWTFPDGSVKSGETVSSGLTSTGVQVVKLSAMINGKEKSWNIEVTVREFVIYSNTWNQDGSTYNGFKGGCPVFSPDGKTVYVLTFNKIAGLHAFDTETGEQKWDYKFETKAGSYNMHTVNPVTGDIYYGTQTAGQFFAVTPEGNLKWQFTGAQSMQAAAPAVSADGTVVFICDNAGNTFALDAASGTQKWSFAAGAQGGGLLVNGTDLVVGTKSKIYFLNADNGEKLAEIADFGTTGMTEISGFAVSNDKKTAYVPRKGGAMASLDLEKRTLKGSLQVAGNDLYEPVVAPNGDVFVGSKDSKVYCVDADLTTVRWSHTHMTTNNAFNYSHPCVDSQNRYMISTGQNPNSNYIFGSDGTVLEQWSYASGDSAQKQMGGNNFNDGVFYSAFVGASGSNGIFVGKWVGGERSSSWGTHGGDICGSCCIK